MSLLVQMRVAVVNDVGDLLPVLLAEVSAVEIEVALAPGFDEGEGGVLAPAILSDRHDAGLLAVDRRRGRGHRIDEIFHPQIWSGTARSGDPI